jgi:hypothetical protein
MSRNKPWMYFLVRHSTFDLCIQLRPDVPTSEINDTDVYRLRAIGSGSGDNFKITLERYDGREWYEYKQGFTQEQGLISAKLFALVPKMQKLIDDSKIDINQRIRELVSNEIDVDLLPTFES